MYTAFWSHCLPGVEPENLPKTFHIIFVKKQKKKEINLY